MYLSIISKVGLIQKVSEFSFLAFYLVKWIAHSQKSLKKLEFLEFKATFQKLSYGIPLVEGRSYFNFNFLIFLYEKIVYVHIF